MATWSEATHIQPQAGLSTLCVWGGRSMGVGGMVGVPANVVRAKVVSKGRTRDGAEAGERGKREEEAEGGQQTGALGPGLRPTPLPA